jgi:hypothetical protein
MRLHLSALLLITPIFIGCNDDPVETVEEELVHIEFTLEQAAAYAGEDIAYSAWLDSGNGGPEIPVDITISSDLESSLWVSGESLQATVAGMHTLTASGTHEGVLYETEKSLEVMIGPPAEVDLVLSDVTTEVGVPIAFEVLIGDGYGNLIADRTATISIDESELTVFENELVTTVPNIYNITASIDGASDSEQLLVTPGPAASLELSLIDDQLEVNETTIAVIDILDQYGNIVDEEWDLWTDNTDGVIVNYNAITFRSEGWFTVWASTTDGTIDDFVGPLLIDSSGPDLTIDNPSRGTQTTDTSVVVTGTATDEYSGVAGVYVDGVTASMDENGNWSNALDYDFGLNIVETSAVDGDANGTADSRGVISGNFNEYTKGVENGLMVRINEDGFDVLGGMAEGFVDASEVAAMIPNPVFQDESESCIDLGWFGSYCFTWYSVTFTISNFNFSSTTVDIDPTNGGYLDTLASVNYPYMNYNASGVVAEIGYSASGTISADGIDIQMDLTPFIAGNNLEVNVGNVGVSTRNFDFDLDSWIYDVMSFFGFDIEGMIEDLMIDELADMAEEEVPEMINDMLAGLDLGQTLDLGDASYELDAVPGYVGVDDLGLTLGLETFFTVNGWTSSYPQTPGSLVYPYSTPNFSTPNGQMEIAIGEDFLNQAFYAMWGGGLLDMTMTGTELGLDPDDLSLFMPNLTDLVIETVAFLPPVIVPGTGTDILDLQVGDLELSLYNGSVSESNLELRVYVHLFAGMGLTTSTDNTLTASLGDMDISFDLVYPNPRSQYAGDTEAFLGALMPLLMPMLTDSLGSFPIPDIDGLTVGNINVALGGAEDGFVIASGDLVSN